MKHLNNLIELLNVQKILVGTGVYFHFVNLPDTELYNKLLENKFEDTKFSGGRKKMKHTIFKNMLELLRTRNKNIRTHMTRTEINFKLNKNLQGRHIKRAISDFERVTKLSESHAFAWNCLALGYEKMQLQEKVKFAKIRQKK